MTAKVLSQELVAAVPAHLQPMMREAMHARRLDTKDGLNAAAGLFNRLAREIEETVMPTATVDVETARLTELAESLRQAARDDIAHAIAKGNGHHGHSRDRRYNNWVPPRF